MKKFRFIACNVPPEMIEAVDCVATDLKVSRSALVRLALESYLARPHLLVQDDPEPATGHSPMTTAG